MFDFDCLCLIPPNSINLVSICLHLLNFVWLPLTHAVMQTFCACFYPKSSFTEKSILAQPAQFVFVIRCLLSMAWVDSAPLQTPLKSKFLVYLTPSPLFNRKCAERSKWQIWLITIPHYNILFINNYLEF